MTNPTVKASILHVVSGPAAKGFSASLRDPGFEALAWPHLQLMEPMKHERNHRVQRGALTPVAVELRQHPVLIPQTSRLVHRQAHQLLGRRRQPCALGEAGNIGTPRHRSVASGLAWQSRSACPGG